MGVIVGGHGPDPARQDRSTRLSFAVTAVALAVMAGFFLTGPAPGDDESGEMTGMLLVDSGRWLPWGTSRATPFDADRLADTYLLSGSGGVSAFDASGETVFVPLPGVDSLRGVTADGTTGIAYGASAEGPAIWRTGDGREWELVPLPWQGAVQAASLVDGAVVALGIDTTEGPHQVAGRWSGEDADPWVTQVVDAPDTIFHPVEGGFVAFGRLQGGAPGYLFSSDGVRWEALADNVVIPVGELAAVVEDELGRGLRIPGDDRRISPPEWPVAALWRVGERIWVQTPAAAWWSLDGRRWTRLPLDRSHGIEQGLPTLFPFDDRAAVFVGGTRGEPREILMWILGA